MRHVLIFANPIAGRGRGRRIAAALVERLRLAGFAGKAIFENIETIHPGSDAARSLEATNAHAAVVIGGDGTLRTVADRLLSICAPDPPPPLTIIPLGTANLMSQHLLKKGTQLFSGARASDPFFESPFLIQKRTPGIDEMVAAIQRRSIVQLDAARANGKLFLLMAGVGIDGAIVHELARVRNGPIDFLSYALPAALALRDYTYPALRVVADDAEIFSSRPAMAFVGNIAEYGTGFPVLPDARPDDNLLDVCVLPCRNRAKLIEVLLRAAADEHRQIPGAVYRKAKRVSIHSEAPVPVQIDGDAAGHTPLEIKLLPIKVPFIVA